MEKFKIFKVECLDISTPIEAKHIGEFLEEQYGGEHGNRIYVEEIPIPEGLDFRSFLLGEALNEEIESKETENDWLRGALREIHIKKYKCSSCGARFDTWESCGIKAIVEQHKKVHGKPCLCEVPK